MKLFINGKIEEMEDGTSISRALELKNIRPEVVTVELNEKIINKNNYKEIFFKESDKLEFVYYMGGGYVSE